MARAFRMQRPTAIRRLTIEDYEALMDLWRRAGLSSLRPRGRDSRESFARQLSGGRQTVLGLSRRQQLVGAVVATHDGRKGWINRLAVDPECRRQGYARRLIAAAEAVLGEQGIHVIAVLIEGDNKASLDLFKDAGYQLGDVHYLSKRDSSEA